MFNNNVKIFYTHDVRFHITNIYIYNSNLTIDRLSWTKAKKQNLKNFSTKAKDGKKTCQLGKSKSSRAHTVTALSAYIYIFRSSAIIILRRNSEIFSSSLLYTLCVWRVCEWENSRKFRIVKSHFFSSEFPKTVEEKKGG